MTLTGQYFPRRCEVSKMQAYSTSAEEYKLTISAHLLSIVNCLGCTTASSSFDVVTCFVTHINFQ